MVVVWLLVACLLHVLVAALVVRCSWNGMLAEPFRFRPLRYWQAVKLILLGYLLLGGVETLRLATT